MKLTCRIVPVDQGSDEWMEYRSRLFTASELGMYLVEEPKCRLKKDEMVTELKSLGIRADPKAKNEELEKLFPDITPYLAVTKEAVQSRMKLIRRKAELHTKEGRLLADEENRKLGFNFDIKRGTELEPAARASYAKLTGNDVVQVGLCVHESSHFCVNGVPLDGFGCSPDGLIQNGEVWKRGLEIKSPRPSVMMEWLDDGVLPECHVPQVHASMAVTGLSEWDFFAYCPELPPLLVTVEWSEITDRMLIALKTLHSDFLIYRRKLGRMKPLIVRPQLAA